MLWRPAVSGSDCQPQQREQPNSQMGGRWLLPLVWVCRGIEESQDSSGRSQHPGRSLSIHGNSITVGSVKQDPFQLQDYVTFLEKGNYCTNIMKSVNVLFMEEDFASMWEKKSSFSLSDVTSNTKRDYPTKGKTFRIEERGGLSGVMCDQTEYKERRRRQSSFRD